MKRDRPPLSEDVRFDRESSTEQSGRLPLIGFIVVQPLPKWNGREALIGETAPGRAPAESPT